MEYRGRQMIAAEVCMVEHVEKLRPEFQHPAFSQEPQLCLLHQRKVPIPFGWPAQDIAPGCAKLADKRTWCRYRSAARRLLSGRARRYGRDREHGRVEPLVGVAGNDGVGIVDDRLVGAWITPGGWLARLRGARISGQQSRRIDIDPVPLLGLRDTGIRAIVSHYR